MVPSSPTDDISDSDEDELREQVLDGLRLALNDELAEGSTMNRRDLTKIEEEKLLYFAIRDLELPLTYSWYLVGVKTKSDTGSSAQIASPPSPNGSHSIPSVSEESEPERSNVNSEVERYRQYFRESTFFDDYTLKKVVFTDKTEFLCDFYEACADEKYVNLYVHSTKLRQKFEKIDNLIEVTDKDVTLSDWEGGSEDGIISQNKEKKFRRLVSKVQLDLARTEGFNECRIPVRKATDEIEIILTKLTHLSSLTYQQKEIVYDLGDFFYNTIWRYPCLKISAETATGPNEDALRREREREFSTFHNNIQRRTETLREKRIEEGLCPSSEEFTANEKSEVMDSFHKAARKSLEDN